VHSDRAADQAQRCRCIEDRGHEVGAIDRLHRGRDAEEIEERRREVDERDQVLPNPGRHARDMDRERDADERVIGDRAVRIHEPRITAERFAVIAQEHDDRRIGEVALRERGQDVTDLVVDRAE